MRVVIVGTVSAYESDVVHAGEVVYSGEWALAPDDATSLMVWDDAIGNVRPMTPAEIAALATSAQKARSEAAAIANAGDTAAAGVQERLIRGLLTALVWAFNQPPGHTITLQDLKTQAKAYIDGSAV